MRSARKSWWVPLALALALPALAVAQGKADFGKAQYDGNCAVCHGVSGKGGGPLGELLKRSASDLTTLQKRNGGIFPMARVYDTIEGGGVAEHGTRDMPVWGREFSIKAAEYYIDVPYNQEAYVRARILALVEYLSRLQAK
jgi:mono/diheme cytochrome c family protein